LGVSAKIHDVYFFTLKLMPQFLVQSHNLFKAVEFVCTLSFSVSCPAFVLSAN
jgi:hypothetical protein